MFFFKEREKEKKIISIFYYYFLNRPRFTCVTIHSSSFSHPPKPQPPKSTFNRQSRSVAALVLRQSQLHRSIVIAFSQCRRSISFTVVNRQSIFQPSLLFYASVVINFNFRSSHAVNRPSRSSHLSRVHLRCSEPRLYDLSRTQVISNSSYVA